MEPNITLPPTQIKIWSALLTQGETSAPIPTILHNTLGQLTWTYHNIGDYRATSSGLFKQNKTQFILGLSEGVNVIFYPARLDNNTIQILAYNNGSASDTWTNLNLEIRVYN